MQRRHGASERRFEGDRPTVLYAPHCKRELSSWDCFGRDIIAWFAGQDRYNLVVTPHVRLFAEASDAERAAVAKLAVPGKVMIDLASDRSEEHTSELQSLMRISYAVFCLKKKNTTQQHTP